MIAFVLVVFDSTKLLILKQFTTYTDEQIQAASCV